MRPWMGIGLTAFVCLCPLRTPAAPSAAIVFKDPKVADMQLSPSGRYVSSIMALNGGMNLVVIDLVDSTKSPLTEYPSPGQVLAVHWKSDDTLVYISSGNVKGFEQHDEWAINRHGKQIRNLYHWIPSTNEVAFPGIIDWLPEVTNTVLEAVGRRDLDHPSDAHFFRVIRAEIGPGGTSREETMAGGRDCAYVVDHEGNVRVCLSKEADLRRLLHYRDTAKSPWRELSVVKYGDSEITPLAFAVDNKHLYVLSNFRRNTRALFEFDPESNDLKGPLVEIPDADLFQGVFGNDGRSLIGVRYHLRDQVRVYYLDDAMAALQKSMSAAFPTRRAAIHSVSDDLARVIVRLDSDQSAGQFYLYDNAKHSLERLADRAPWIDPAQFGEQKAVRFAARDGTTLDGYLTLPPDREAKALPLLLWPSGGPGSRAAAGWNPTAQFLATRGYAVLRVNNRWASGYIQTDLLDSIDWAVSEGLIVKDRVALYGEDLGGYVALMATAGAPDAYRCVISYAGEINLERLFDRVSSSRTLWRERSDDELASWRKLLGGRDTAFLKDRSPLYNADKIRGPVFLAYSVDDTLVPYSDAEELKKALERAHKSVVLLAKNQEPHLFDKEQDKVDLFTKVETFLQGCNPAE
jgi:dienelactone hydrolase